MISENVSRWCRFKGQQHVSRAGHEPLSFALVLILGTTTQLIGCTAIGTEVRTGADLRDNNTPF